jgi:hypothetical protein
MRCKRNNKKTKVLKKKKKQKTIIRSSENLRTTENLIQIHKANPNKDSKKVYIKIRKNKEVTRK